MEFIGAAHSDLQKIAEAAQALLRNSGGLLLPYKVYEDGSTIRLYCLKADVVALDEALKAVESEPSEYEKLYGVQAHA
jgi:hypothetical protein